MKTVKEMLTDVRADQAQRQQLEQEQEKKKLDCQQAVALAEKELQDALARQDQEAYHAAEGRLSYAREVLHTFEAADPWWTQEEAQEIVSAAYNAYVNETREKYKKVFELLMNIDALLSDIYHIGMDGYSIKRMVSGKTALNPDYGISITRKMLPKSFADEVAHMAGTTYIPPKRL